MGKGVIQLRFKTVVAIILVTLSSILVAGCSSNSNTEKVSVNEYPIRYLILTAGKCGFIDEKGSIVIKPTFENVNGCFSEGLCAVEVKGKWGYIDSSGAFVINPQFVAASPFFEGMALIMKDGKYGYIDNTGKIIIAPQFEKCSSFSEDLAPVFAAGKWGFIDKKGKMIINPEYDAVSKYTEGLAAVSFGGREGFIDNTGKYVINPQYFKVANFSEGLACFQQSLFADYGYINKTSQIAITPQFSEAGKFSEGMARVKIGDKWGYIDKNGKILINLTYDDADDFSEGLACVKVGDKWGFIDKPGNYVINPQYDGAIGFMHGLAAVFKYNELADTVTMTYIDATGKSIWSLDMNESDLIWDEIWESSDDGLPGFYSPGASGDSIIAIPLSEAFWDISASSTLQPGATLRYEPELIMDNDNSTSWVEGMPDDGIGEWIMFSLPGNQVTTVCEIDIYNGYQASEDLYYANNRIKKVRIDYSDGTSTTAELEDNNYPFYDTVFAVGENINYVKITILEVYPGNKYQDTCISEVVFN